MIATGPLRAIAAAAVAVAVAACAGGRDAPATGTVATGGPGPAGFAREKVVVKGPLPWPSTALEAITVTESADAAVLEVSASSPLVWTSYRDGSGDFVLELIGAKPAEGVGRPALEGASLIASVDVELSPMLSHNRGQREAREMTRMVVRTREPAVHALRTRGTNLLLTFTPSRPRAPATASAPPAAPEAAAPTPAPAAPAAPAVEVADLGGEAPVPLYETIDDPDEAATATESAAATPAVPPDPPPREAAPSSTAPSGPTPDGPRGDTLIAVETRTHGAAVEIRLIGNGSLVADPPFELAGPARLVIDLPGVTAEVRERTHYVGHALVDRVRIGQFQVGPDIARVVLDLGVVPIETRIETVRDGLILVVDRR